MATHNDVERARREGTLLGIPLGDLGWLQSLLMGTATGFAAFLLATFVAIISLLIYATTTHHAVDYAIAYKRIGFPVGLIVLALALGFLALQYARRLARKSHSV